jgi:hypothetical protein
MTVIHIATMYVHCVYSESCTFKNEDYVKLGSARAWAEVGTTTEPSSQTVAAPKAGCV